MQAIDDYRWLVGPDAAGWLSQAADWPEPLLAQAARLRKTLTPARAALVLQQVALRERRIGRLEITKRGVSLDPEQVRRQLAPEGDQSATLLLGLVGNAVRAILAQRLSALDR